MMKRMVVAVALALSLGGCNKQPDAVETRSPTLANRQEIIQERDRMSEQLVRPGDTLTIYVFMMIDARGVVHQPEVKQQAEQRAIDSALRLVNMMHFRPATREGKPVQVLLKVPVRFARPAQP